MKTILSRFALDESGATAIEYGLIAGLVSIVIVASLTTIGASLTNTFTAVNGAFAGAGN
jgi:pilus assembly protein Flp/PilA